MVWYKAARVFLCSVSIKFCKKPLQIRSMSV
nr:MAG TPA: hypothetical protein [Bacteriophage sp.]